jgi:enoyl-CoA hydratase/carnithine racemase
VSFECIEYEPAGRYVTIRMNLPDKRNALSEAHLLELIRAFELAAADAAGIILAGAGPVFCAGHDYADMADRDIGSTRDLLQTCRRLMDTIHSIAPPVLARVHGLATAAGCQLVAAVDLAVAGRSAGFATPGGRGGSFCHTPLVEVVRVIGHRRALEMGLTGDVIDAETAAAWGLVNRVVPDDDLDDACVDLLDRATRGSRSSKALGKLTFHRQAELSRAAAYDHAIEVRAGSSAAPATREHVAAFLEKRPAVFDDA